MKISHVGAELFYAGEQADRHNAVNSRLSYICEGT
jgi:hypothetical protein